MVNLYISFIIFLCDYVTSDTKFARVNISLLYPWLAEFAQDIIYRFYTSCLSGIHHLIITILYQRMVNAA